MAWIPSLQSLALQEAPKNSRFLNMMNTTTLRADAQTHYNLQYDASENHLKRIENKRNRAKNSYNTAKTNLSNMITALHTLQTIYETLSTPYMRHAIHGIEKDIVKQKQLISITESKFLLASNSFTALLERDLFHEQWRTHFLEAQRIYDDMIIFHRPLPHVSILVIPCGDESVWCAIQLTSRNPTIWLELKQHWSQAYFPYERQEADHISKNAIIPFATSTLSCRLKGLSRADQPYYCLSEARSEASSRVYLKSPDFWPEQLGVYIDESRVEINNDKNHYNSKQPLKTSTNNVVFDQCLKVMKIAVTRLKLIREAQNLQTFIKGKYPK